GPYYRSMVQELEAPISAYTGTVLPQSTEVFVMDRKDWIAANVANFRELFEPIDELYVEISRAQGPTLPGVPQAGQAVISGQVGALLGYLARRVLGQYDMSLLGKELLTGGKLYFVEPNIRTLQNTMTGVPIDELRRWIALHESTHAHEFEVYPWVRGYMNDHLERYLRSVIGEMRRGQDGNLVSSFLTRLIENLRSGRSMLESMMTEEQREIVSRLQALMSLAEGYSNHVMNAVGREILPSFDLIHERVEQRQQRRGRAEELFLRITGLKMKMEQYRLGEAFTNEVVQHRDISFLNLAWQAPQNLPTEWEIQHPQDWIKRIDQQQSSITSHA
ncbi:MAG TPA: zinc-dependent metalloprotease, partial [Chloroflexota bacterium]|nr:zinc-dependent metalloprotease [Chloroflexota bacterium]